MVNKIELYLADDDAVYLERLSMYLLSKRNMFQLHTFSEFEKLENAVRDGNARIDILAVSEQFQQLITEKINAKVRILLCEQSDGGETDGWLHVNKFQKTDNLIAQLLQAYEQETGQPYACSKGSTAARIWGVYSPIGGVGKTAFALLLSRAAVKAGAKAFYLNMEYISSFQRDGAQGQSLSNVFLALDTKGANLEPPIRANTVQEEQNGVSMFAAPESTLEWNDIGIDKAHRLLTTLSGMVMADVIIIDFDGELNADKVGLLQRCDHVLVPVQMGDSAERKLQAFRRELDLQSAQMSALASRLLYVQNRSDKAGDASVPCDAVYASLDQCFSTAPVPPVLTRIAQEWLRG